MESLHFNLLVQIKTYFSLFNSLFIFYIGKKRGTVLTSKEKLWITDALGFLKMFESIMSKSGFGKLYVVPIFYFACQDFIKLYEIVLSNSLYAFLGPKCPH